MNDRMKHLLPNDRMKIFQEDAFNEDAELVLAMLYQPLIGMKSVAVFQSLWKEASVQPSQSSISHHQMMSRLNMTLDDFYEARKKIEAIGLLKSFKEEGSFTTFYYYLNRPYSVKGFFEDPMLSVLLEHHLGKEDLNQLKRKLLIKTSRPTNVKEVTKRFDEVFTTIKPEMVMQQATQAPSDDTLVVETKLPVEWLHKMLQQQKVNPKNILSTGNIRFIEKMTHIYDVDFLELEKAVLWAVDEQQQFDRKEFLDMCKDIYYKKHGSIPPRLYTKNEDTQNTSLKEQPSKTKPQPANEKEAQIIQHFESVTHREILEDHSSSGKASMKEVNMLTDMMEEHGLSQPVMNVLVHYVLNKIGNKLSKNYIETIAAHWSRAHITTAKEAMDLAKQENNMYQKWQQKNQQKTQSYNKQQKSKEVLPKWYQEEKNQKKTSQQPAQQRSAPQDDKEQEELEKFFKSFSRSNHKG
ncbi:replication initiation and membrane attachment family protein [Halalkalibacillus sediminis]|nr:DnaD domain protein [Halalkalibacillus sediminis]